MVSRCGTATAVALSLTIPVMLSACAPAHDDLPIATDGRVEFADGNSTEFTAPFGQGPPLGYVVDEGLATVMYSQGLFRVEDDGDVVDTTEFDSPAFGVELVRSDRGTAALFVLPEMDGEAARSRLVWIDDDVKVLRDVAANLSLVGVLPEGVVIRNGPDTAPLSIVDWDGDSYPLGTKARDAALVPESPYLVTRTDETSQMAVRDVETGQAVTVSGLPRRGVTFAQVAISPARPEIVVDLRDLRSGSRLGLWTLAAAGSGLTARKVADLDPGDILAGFVDDGARAAVVRGTGVVGMALDTGATSTLRVPSDATPVDWSRSVLTMAALRSAT